MEELSEGYRSNKYTASYTKRTKFNIITTLRIRSGKWRLPLCKEMQAQS